MSASELSFSQWGAIQIYVAYLYLVLSLNPWIRISKQFIRRVHIRPSKPRKSVIMTSHSAAGAWLPIHHAVEAAVATGSPPSAARCDSDRQHRLLTAASARETDDDREIDRRTDGHLQITRYGICSARTTSLYVAQCQRENKVAFSLTTLLYHRGM